MIVITKLAVPQSKNDKDEMAKNSILKQLFSSIPSTILLLPLIGLRLYTTLNFWIHHFWTES